MKENEIVVKSIVDDQIKNTILPYINNNSDYQLS